MKVKDFLNLMESFLGQLGTEDGLRYGKEENEISGITVCWMASMEVMNSAISNKHNLIIAHEDFKFPPDYAARGVYSEIPPGILTKKRMLILDKHGISLVRLHSSLDRFCILDDFAKKLELGEPVVRKDFYRVYEIKPVSLREFAESVKRNFDISQVRVSGQLSQQVRRVGALWGGLGLSINACFIDGILGHSVDTVIAGETDEYAMRAFLDLSIGVVEVGHEVSENTGLENYARILKEKLPDVPVKFLSNSYPWRTL